MSGTRLALYVLLALLAGCAGIRPPAGTEAGACLRWYADLDSAIESEGVRDAQETRVAGFPYLRVDRFHASLRQRAAASPAAFDAYADALLELDLRARRFEIRNLRKPPWPPQEADRRTMECGRLLRDVDLAAPERRAELLGRAQVPDDYSALARGLGLYALTRNLFASGVRRWESETRAAFQAGPSAPQGATRIRYAPPAGAPLSRSQVAELLSRALSDPLGRVNLSAEERMQLAALYAPSFDIAVRGDADRFGALRWLRGSETPQVDAAQVVAYVSTSYTRYGRAGRERNLLQLVYTIWFAERPPFEEGDLYSGRLDGLVWRVTLAPDGEPLVYDSIHPCGCYHQFFPTPRAAPRPAPDPVDEWAFVPGTLGRVGDGERPRVRVTSGTHYIDGVEIVKGADSLVRYAFADYDELRSLRRMDGGFRSAFGPDGLIAGTERGERFLFWPMGIASAGAMRQAGRQPTAFVGRRHFDDADLIERRFALDLGAGP